MISSLQSTFKKNQLITQPVDSKVFLSWCVRTHFEGKKVGLLFRFNRFSKSLVFIMHTTFTQQCWLCQRKRAHRTWVIAAWKTNLQRRQRNHADHNKTCTDRWALSTAFLPLSSGRGKQKDWAIELNIWEIPYHRHAADGVLLPLPSNENGCDT